MEGNQPKIHKERHLASRYQQIYLHPLRCEAFLVGDRLDFHRMIWQNLSLQYCLLQGQNLQVYNGHHDQSEYFQVLSHDKYNLVNGHIQLQELSPR